MELFQWSGRDFVRVGCLAGVLLASSAVQSRAESQKPGTKLKTEILSFDKNGDKRPDKWAVFIDGAVAEIGYDRNHDGKRDFWEFLNPNGRMARTESDRNFDGRPDLIVYYENGNLAFKVVDDNYDGVPERMVYFDGDERVGLTSQDLEQIRSEPDKALKQEGRPGKARTTDTKPAGAKKPTSGKKVAIIRPADPRTPPDLLPVPGTPVEPPEETDTPAYFPLGTDFPLRVPVPGGAGALEESRVWTIEREARLFRWPDSIASFEIQNTPTQGAIRIRYEVRDDEGSDPDEFDRRRSNFARKVFGRLIYVSENQRAVQSGIGQGNLETYTVKAGRQTWRVSLCTVRSQDYWVYFMAASPRQTHEALESALIEMLRGARIG